MDACYDGSVLMSSLAAIGVAKRRKCASTHFTQSPRLEVQTASIDVIGNGFLFFFFVFLDREKIRECRGERPALTHFDAKENFLFLSIMASRALAL